MTGGGDSGQGSVGIRAIHIYTYSALQGYIHVVLGFSVQGLRASGAGRSEPSGKAS